MSKWIALYLISAVLSYGIFLGYFEGEYRELHRCREHVGSAVFWGLFAPVTLPVGFLFSGFAEHGLQFTCSEPTV